jgi:predicted enzyme related to lactoylglutathione lyase
MNPVSWFEIPVSDFDRAKSFYETILDLTIAENDVGNSKMGWFPMDMSAPGSAGAIIKHEAYVPSHEGTMVYLSVIDIESTLQRIDANGGKTLMGKQSIGEFGFVANFEDTEGNRVALHSSE